MTVPELEAFSPGIDLLSLTFKLNKVSSVFNTNSFLESKKRADK